MAQPYVFRYILVKMYLQMSFDVVCLCIELADLQHFTSIALTDHKMHFVIALLSNFK